MPRPYPATLTVTPPKVAPFELDDFQKRAIARVLGIERLPTDCECTLANAISVHKATAGASRATVGNTLAALFELKRKGRAYKRAVERLADDRSGVDYTTLNAVQPLARAVLNDGSATNREALAHAALERADVLTKHKRVDSQTEPLRFFCGFLRLIFNRYAAPTPGHTIEDRWRHCRRFAMEVFDVAGIDTANFVAHPDRLTDYLRTDITIDWLTCGGA